MSRPRVLLGVLILSILVFSSLALAASGSYSFKLVVDRTAPSVTCSGDRSLTNGGHGNWIDWMERPNKDFMIKANVQDPGEVHAPIVVVGYKVDGGTESYLGLEGVSKIFKDLPEDPHESETQYRSDDGTGMGYFDVNNTADLKNWNNYGDLKTFYFGAYSGKREGRINVKCYARDILGQEGDANYDTYSQEIKFCGLPVKEYTDIYYYCVNKKGDVLFLGVNSYDGVENCVNQSDINAIINNWLDSVEGRRDVLNWGCYRQTYSYIVYESSAYRLAEPVEKSVEGFRCIRDWFGPSETDGNCCADLDMINCIFQDSRYQEEYNNRAACIWVEGKFDCGWGLGEWRSGCLDISSYYLIFNQNCFSGILKDLKKECDLTNKEYNLIC